MNSQLAKRETPRPETPPPSTGGEPSAADTLQSADLISVMQHIEGMMTREQAIAYISHVMVHRHSINHADLERGVANSNASATTRKHLISSIKRQSRKFAANDSKNC